MSLLIRLAASCMDCIRRADSSSVTADDAVRVFTAASIVIDTGRLQGEPSTIVDVSDPTGPRVVREGRLKGVLDGPQ